MTGAPKKIIPSVTLEQYRKLSGKLAKRKARAAIMGGWAVQVWANPPATVDLDILTDLARDGVKGFLEAPDVAREYRTIYPLVPGDEEALADVDLLPVAFLYPYDYMPKRLWTAPFEDVFRGVFVRVDLFLADSYPYQFALARSRVIDGVRLVDPEGLVLTKLRSRREKDKRHMALLVGLPGFDQAWVRKHAQVMGVEDEFDRVLGGEYDLDME